MVQAGALKVLQRNLIHVLRKKERKKDRTKERKLIVHPQLFFSCNAVASSTACTAFVTFSVPLETCSRECLKWQALWVGWQTTYACTGMWTKSVVIVSDNELFSEASVNDKEVTTHVMLLFENYIQSMKQSTQQKNQPAISGSPP
jgi:hypothetical protein